MWGKMSSIIYSLGSTSPKKVGKGGGDIAKYAIGLELELTQ